jgi:hypothetical protein
MPNVSSALSNMPSSPDRTPMNPPSRGPVQSAWTAMDRRYVGMREISANECVDHDVIAQDALTHHLAAQAAFDSRRIKEAERKEWAAAAVGIVWLIVSLGALLVANTGYVWR